MSTAASPRLETSTRGASGAELAEEGPDRREQEHPCTAFDKWSLIPVLDDDDRVVDAVRTVF